MRSFLGKNIFLISFGVTLLVSLKIYLLYFNNLSFGDEYDNFVYSWLLTTGHIPYKDYFLHHYPLATFLGATMTIIGHSKTLFRVFVLIITFSFFSYFSFYLKGIWRWVMLVFMLISSFAISLYSGQQFADSVFLSIFILSAFFLVLGKGNRAFSFLETLVFSAFTFGSCMISPQYLLPFVLLIIYHLKNCYFPKKLLDLRFIRWFLFWMILFTALLAIYLFLSGSFWDFYYDTIVFNGSIYYYHLYTPYISFKPLDFYLHTSWDVYNNFFEIVKFQGAELLKFIRSIKYILLPFLIKGDVTLYYKVIFTELYNNFFTFEVFITLFYLFGVVSLILKKKNFLAFFSIIFIFGIRLRILEKIHMAPYYLFSYFLVSLAIVIFFENIIKKRKRILNIFLLFSVLFTISLFTIKNWGDFAQIAFNTFPTGDEKIVSFLNSNSAKGDQIIVFSNFSSSYAWDSGKLPYGHFPNFFEWYDESPKLKRLFLGDLKSYDGKFLIVNKESWDNFCKLGKPDWRDPYFAQIRGDYKSLELKSTNAKEFFEKELVFGKKSTPKENVDLCQSQN